MGGDAREGGVVASAKGAELAELQSKVMSEAEVMRKLEEISAKLPELFLMPKGKKCLRPDAPSVERGAQLRLNTRGQQETNRRIAHSMSPHHVGCDTQQATAALNLPMPPTSPRLRARRDDWIHRPSGCATSLGIHVKEGSKESRPCCPN